MDEIKREFEMIIQKAEECIAIIEKFESDPFVLSTLGIKSISMSRRCRMVVDLVLEETINKYSITTDDSIKPQDNKQIVEDLLNNLFNKNKEPLEE